MIYSYIEIHYMSSFLLIVIDEISLPLRSDNYMTELSQTLGY